MHSKQLSEAPLNGLFKTIYTAHAEQRKDHNNQGITQTNGLHLYQALAKR